MLRCDSLSTCITVVLTAVNNSHCNSVGFFVGEMQCHQHDPAAALGNRAVVLSEEALAQRELTRRGGAAGLQGTTQAAQAPVTLGDPAVPQASMQTKETRLKVVFSTCPLFSQAILQCTVDLHMT